MAEHANETSGIRFPPPLIYAGLFALGYVLHRLVPVRLMSSGPARVVGWVFVAGALILLLGAAVLFRQAGTTPNPTKPTTALVVRGPYRFTRNPMYVALAALYLGLTLLVNDVWPLVLLPVVLALVQWRVIAREEAYLARKFGDQYRAYKARVRRWI